MLAAKVPSVDQVRQAHIQYQIDASCTATHIVRMTQIKSEIYTFQTHFAMLCIQVIKHSQEQALALASNVTQKATWKKESSHFLNDVLMSVFGQKRQAFHQNCNIQ